MTFSFLRILTYVLGLVGTSLLLPRSQQGGFQALRVQSAVSANRAIEAPLQPCSSPFGFRVMGRFALTFA